MHRQISDSNPLTPDPSPARGEGNAQPFLIYKLGGSLLMLPDLAERLTTEFARRPERPLLIVGGGEAADIVRRWDKRFQIGEERAHWLALQAMALNERLVQSILPDSQFVASVDDVNFVLKTPLLPILCAHNFLRHEEAAEATLEGGIPALVPHTWDVTSDSIAAWAALRLNAAGLVLLKSCDAPGTLIHEWSNGDVDPYFSKLAPQLPRVEWVNLRANSNAPIGKSESS